MANPAAQELGRLGKGKPKKLTEAQRDAKRKLLAEARKSRWIKKP